MLNSILEDPIALFFIGTIIVFFIWFVSAELIQIAQKKRALNNTVQSYRDFVQQISGNDWVLDQTSQDFYNIARLNLVYEELEQGMLRLKHKNNKLISVNSLESLLPHFKSSNSGFVPSFLTSIGILGTFIGITLGLSGLDLNETDSKALVQGASGLLEGMKTAFVTSLVGLSAAALFMIVNSFSTKRRVSIYHDGKNSLSNSVHVVTAIEYLKALDPSKQDKLASMQEKSMESLQQAGAQFGQVVDSLSSFNPEIMGEEIGKRIQQAMQEEFKPLFESMSNEIKVLREIKQDNGEKVIEVLTTSLKEEIISPVANQIRDISVSVKESNEAVGTLTAKLDGVVCQLTGSIETIQNFQTDTLEKLNLFADGLDTTLKAVGEQIRDSLQVAKEGMEDQRQAFVSSARDASDLMDKAKDNLLEGLGNIDQQISRIKDALMEELETFRVEYQKNLKDYFDQQNDQLGSLLSKQENGLLRVIEQYEKAYTIDLEQRSRFVSETHEAVDQIVESTKTLNELVNAVSMFDQSQAIELITQSQTQKEVVDSLSKSYSEGTEAFEKRLNDFENALTSYFENTTDRTQKFFKEVDDSTATIMQNLTAAANAIAVANNSGVKKAS